MEVSWFNLLGHSSCKIAGNNYDYAILYGISASVVAYCGVLSKLLRLMWDVSMEDLKTSHESQQEASSFSAICKM
jgi:hypothetical protein